MTRTSHPHTSRSTHGVGTPPVGGVGRTGPTGRASRTTGLRVVGALTSAVAVAFVGTAALPPATAAAAGVTDDRPHPAPRPPGGPAALPGDPGTRVAATYRWVEGRWVPV